MGKFIARYPTAFGATMVAMITLVGALLVVSHQADEARQQAEQARAAKDFLVEMIGQTDPFVDAESATLIQSLKQAIPSIATRFDGQPLLESEMRYAIGYALQNLGETTLSRQQFERSLDLRKQYGSHLDQAESLQGIGIVDWWDSAYQQGVDHFTEALTLIGADSSERAVILKVNTLANLAAMQTEAAEHETSAKHSRLALEYSDQAAYISDETRANLWGNLATAEESLGHYDEAEFAFSQTLKLLQQSVGTNHPSYAIALNNYAFLFYAKGELQRAVELFKQSVDIRRITLGEQHPQTATALGNLAGALIATGDFSTAKSYALEALDVARQGYNPGHWRIGKAHQMLARVYHELKRSDLAKQNAVDAIEIFNDTEGEFTSAIDEMKKIIE